MADTVEDFFADVKAVKKPSADRDTVSSFFDEVEEKEEKTYEPLPEIEDRSLKVDDIVETQSYVDAIRDYMVDRKGKQFISMDKEKLVDKFVTHMRYFNTNEAFTIDEARYVSKADQDTKAMAGKAYKVYDMLGNVFVNDGFGGAVGGVADYLGAIASSPSTYFGLGVGKAISAIGGKVGAQAIKTAAKEASQQAIQKGLKEGAKFSALKKLSREATDDYIKQVVRGRSLKNVGITGALDGTVAGIQDYGLQNDILLETGAIDSYNVAQTGLSVLGSGIGTGLSIYGVPKITGAEKRGITVKEKGKEKEVIALSDSVAGKIKAANEVKKQKIKDQAKFEKEQKKFIEAITKRAEGMKDVPLKKILRPYDYTGFSKLAKGLIEDDPALEVTDDLPSDVLNFILGKADDSPTENIVRLVESQGPVFRSNMNPAQKYSLAFKYLNEETLTAISDLTKRKFGVYLGDVLDSQRFATNLGKKVAASISEAAKKLRTVQLDRLSTDEALTKSTLDFLDNQSKLSQRTGLGAPKNLATRSAGYLQNIWKRTLVSAPQTTAANVFGFGQYYIANTAVELLQAAGYGLTGDGGKFKALMTLQHKKFKNLLDPYSTLDNYDELLKTDDRLGRLLRETIAGGIERTAKRFDLNEESKALKFVEGTVNAAQNISMVNLQDTLTKSQMFMSSIDKNLRLIKGKTFDDVLEEGNLIDVDDEVMERAMSETLKSVFAEDYTKDATFGGLAKIVENASNTPGIGFVLPFGRFMNNVVATAFRYSPVAFLQAASAIAKNPAGRKKMDFMEAFARGLVGFEAIRYAMSFQEDSEKRGYQWYELETGTGEVTNITNTFPLSLLMITGRLVNKSTRGDYIDKDFISEFGKQIAIGQAATDLQFGNDITRLIGLTVNLNGDFKSPLASISDTVAHTSGNIVSGLLRPADFANKLFGYAFEGLTPYDVTPMIDRRQAKGFGEKFTLNATKYVDNIIEGVQSVIQGETVLLGDELRVAAREGTIEDASPYRTATGTRIQQPRTFANIVFGMVNKPEWKTGMYTGVPEFDRLANKMIAPLIELEAEELLKEESFVKGSADVKKQKVNDMLNEVKKNVRKYLALVPEEEGGIEYRKSKLLTKPKIKMKRARELAGIEGKDVRDLSEDEISKLETALDLIGVSE